MDFGSRDTISWDTLSAMVAFHVLAVVALFYVTWSALLVAFILHWVCIGWGIGMGYHRLHTHRAYKGFRDLRAYFRRDKTPIDSHAIAGTLIKYSEKGKVYVDLLRHIIEKNDLRALDGAQLGDAYLEFRPDA